MKRFLTCIFLLASYCKIANGQEMVKNSEHLEIPVGFKIVAQNKGDLDKDGIAELVVLFDTPKQTDLGTARQIYIYKKAATNWVVWHKSKGGVLSSEHGGVMGDPFDGMEINHGVLIISHQGGSVDKWTYTHRYRYQNNMWCLIGANVTWGRADQVSSMDYNLSTGEVEVFIDKRNEFTNPKAKTEALTFFRKLKAPILMDSIRVGENEVKVPHGHDPFYF